MALFCWPVVSWSREGTIVSTSKTQLVEVSHRIAYAETLTHTLEFQIAESGDKHLNTLNYSFLLKAIRKGHCLSFSPNFEIDTRKTTTHPIKINEENIRLLSALKNE
jgi:hypothetical protein